MEVSLFSSTGSAKLSIEAYKLKMQHLEKSIMERRRRLTNEISPTPSLCSRCLIVGTRLENIISSATDEVTRLEALGGGSRDAVGNIHLGPLSEIFAQEDCTLCCLIAKQLLRDRRFDIYLEIAAGGIDGLTLDRILDFVSPPDDTEGLKMELRELDASAVQICLSDIPRDGAISIWWPQHVADDANDESTRLMMLSEDHRLKFPDEKPWFPLPRNMIWEERNIEMLLKCYSTCLEHHGGCKPVSRVFRPSRVIDVEEMKIATIAPGATPAYFALSYVWGQVPFLTLNRENLSELHTMDFLCEQALPRTVRDAIQVTREFGCRYLWVDALCIIQDDENDKAHQIARMHHIYTQAQLTIVAATGDNADSGLLAIDSAYHEIEPHIIGGCRFTTAVREMRDNVEFSTWFSRGLTFQELVFSGRILYFTPDRTYFTCTIGNWSEDFPINEDVSPDEKDPARDEDPKSDFAYGAEIDPFENYSSMVEKMCTRKFTNESDVLIASRGFYSGLLSQRLGGSVCGLPANCFEFALAWQPSGKLTKRIVPPNGLSFPSWSWASWAESISYPFLSGPKKLNPSYPTLWRICRSVPQAEHLSKEVSGPGEIILEPVLPVQIIEPDTQNSFPTAWKSLKCRIYWEQSLKSRGKHYQIAKTDSSRTPSWAEPSVGPVAFIDAGLLIFDAESIACTLQETAPPKLAERRSLQHFSIMHCGGYIGELKIDSATLASIPRSENGTYAAELISLFSLDFGSTTMQDLLWINSFSERGIFSEDLLTLWKAWRTRVCTLSCGLIETATWHTVWQLAMLLPQLSISR